MKTELDSQDFRDLSSDKESSPEIDKIHNLSMALTWADKKQLAEAILQDLEASKGFLKLLFEARTSTEGIDEAYWHPYEPPSQPSDLKALLFDVLLEQGIRG